MGRICPPPCTQTRPRMAELRNQLPSWSVQLRIALTLLLPAVASLQTLHSTTSPTASLPAPQLTVFPARPVYITGEDVTLTCSATGMSPVSKIRFFHESQEIGSKEDVSPTDRYTDTFQFSPVSVSQVGEYTCQYWKDGSGQEIPSERSQPVSIPVTARPPAPTLTVTSQHQIFFIGESMTLTCSAPSKSTLSGIRFFRDSETTQSRSWLSYTNSLRLPVVSTSYSGAYSCEYWKNVSGREIPSERSRPISIAVTARPPAPKLTVTPQHQIFIVREFVTLTCSAPRMSTLSGIRFFWGTQNIHSKSPAGYSYVVQLPGVSGSYNGAFSCEYWRDVSGREIPSERSQPVSIAVTARPPAPKLTVTPQHQIYIVGESVTLTCSAPSTSTLSGIQFFRNSQTIQSTLYPRSLTGYTDSLQLPAVSGSDAGVYSCEHWTFVSGREIPSQRSQQISIRVTGPPSQPELHVDPPSGMVEEGLSLNITCTAPGGASEHKFHFYKDGAEIVPGHLASKITSTDLGISSVNTSVLTILKASPNNTGEYTCMYEKNMIGRWIPSLGSRAVNITMSGNNTDLRDSLLMATGGILLLAGILAAGICCFRRKKRGQKLQESTKGSEGRECASNLDPSHDNKGSKAMDAGAEQREQGSEVTYALLALSPLEAQTTQSKTKAQPAEEEHVLYSEVVIKQVWKPDK